MNTINNKTSSHSPVAHIVHMFEHIVGNLDNTEQPRWLVDNWLAKQHNIVDIVDTVADIVVQL